MILLKMWNIHFMLMFLMGFLLSEILNKIKLSVMYKDEFTNAPGYDILNRVGSGGEWPDEMKSLCDVKKVSDILGINDNYSYGCDSSQ
tara:strand:- start:22282 stop:22545 length:264 start_codon:yes stop_codon:yes gene_type:complete